MMKNKTIFVYDARGNGTGGVAPTITGDHQNRITDYTAIALEIHGKNIDNSKRSGGGRNPMGYKRHIANTSKSDEAPRTDCCFAR